MKHSAVALPKTMSFDQQPTSQAPFPVSTPSDSESTPPKPGLVAPWWHTVVFVIILVGNSYLTAISLPKVASGSSAKVRALEYFFTIGWEFVLLLIVWLGIRLRGVTLRELIGGRWNRIEDFFIDVAFAGAAVFSAYIVVGLASYFLGLAKPERVAEAKKLAEMLAPDSLKLLALFFVLSTVAGFVEEIIFRGYLQKQFSALTGNVFVGMIIQAVIFGSGHGYEGWQRMIAIFCLGCVFGMLALLRKSLRPGMMAHAMFDSLQGIGLYALKKGLVRM
ncbi:MAG TPA: type II CAAX endopeptidase family protein [Candidatus Angelobacter sp.]|nr:type II CAAX endopeptidase family protein [Candidatus Angelobacter sp.]